MNLPHRAFGANAEKQAHESFVPANNIQFNIGEYEKLFGLEEGWMKLEEEVSSRGIYQVVAPGSPLWGIKVQHPKYGVKWFLSESVAGEENTVEVPLRQRPQLSGVIWDSQMSPVPFVTFDLLILLDNNDLDLGASDDTGFSLLVAGEPGNYTRVARARVKTDSTGSYSVTLPRGIQYALELRTKELYGFAESEKFTIPPTSDVHLDLRLQDDQDGYEVSVVDAEGNPMEGVYVNPNIADDFPWFRQIPGRITDRNGKVHLPVVTEGMAKISLYVRREWDSFDSIYCSPKLFTLPKPPFSIQLPPSVDQD